MSETLLSEEVRIATLKLDENIAELKRALRATAATINRLEVMTDQYELIRKSQHGHAVPTEEK